MPMLEKPNTFSAEFARWAASLNGQRGTRLHEMRRRGFERFEAMGLPSTRDEAFRFTSVEPIRARSYVRAPRGAEISSGDLARLTVPLDGPRLVFVDGRFAPSLSDAERAADSPRIESLATAMACDGQAALPDHLGHVAGEGGTAFAALNTAFLEDGAYVRIPKGRAVDAPISLVYVQTEHSGPTATYPRTLIVAEDGSTASVVEFYVGAGDGETFTNALTEIVVGSRASLDHARIQREGTRAHHVSSTFIAQGSESHFASHAITLGSALARNDILLRFEGEHSEGTLDGLYVADGARHMDTHTLIDHLVPHCNSRQVYRGILDGESHGVFAGRIIVRPDAQKTDAQQSSRNLLLTRKAMANAMPQLEIFADDVRCTHGATVGALDPEAIFYLQARGIPEDAARGLLIHAFAGVVLDRIPIEPLRRSLTDELLEKFTGTERA